MNFRDGTIYGSCVQKVYKGLSNQFDPVNINQIDEVIDRLANWRENIYLVNNLLLPNTDYEEFRPILLEHLNFIDNQHNLAFPINKEKALASFFQVLQDSKKESEYNGI